MNSGFCWARLSRVVFAVSIIIVVIFHCYYTIAVSVEETLLVSLPVHTYAINLSPYRITLAPQSYA